MQNKALEKKILYQSYVLAAKSLLTLGFFAIFAKINKNPAFYFLNCILNAMYFGSNVIIYLLFNK